MPSFTFLLVSPEVRALAEYFANAHVVTETPDGPVSIPVNQVTRDDLRRIAAGLMANEDLAIRTETVAVLLEQNTAMLQRARQIAIALLTTQDATAKCKQAFEAEFGPAESEEWREHPRPENTD